MMIVNSVALPIVELMKRTTIKLEGWKGPVDFVVVKMEDFDVVLGMEFLLEHQVIPMPSAKCLVITRSFSTFVQADICQSNGFKMISTMQLDESPVQEEPPSPAILLGALGKLGETVPKDILCVLEKSHGVMSNSWPKSLSMRRRIDHGIESPSEAKVPAKNAYCTMPPELAVLRKQSKKLLGTGINILGHVVEFHRIEVGKRKIVATCDERIPKSVIVLRPCLELANSCLQRLKQATIKGPSLRVADAIEPPKVEVEQFHCMLGEYLHNLVDGRQKNWVQLLNVAQFGHSAQTDLLIKRSQFEIKGSRHFVLSSLTDGPYVGNSLQVHTIEKKQEHMADITRVCLEEASRLMEESIWLTSPECA
ncbi:gag-asp_proteas domain-containing protein [Cucumis melo var. makuwa]|uniref:Gag-asp_proteas domain-containing protein n=1 Tax=Cucumis melo var. makuwa TaxID=1194695 RepID=A0A5D3CIN4_CUCMM|nr:gag-asp_proteas domain-containing protein [Cucumis melo var. makuwa]